MVCSSGISFDPVIDSTRYTFGFHGIWQGTAVLYDHQTVSYWFHFTGECIDGELKGTVLPRMPTGRHTTWAEWQRTHPNTDVIAQEHQLVGRAGDRGYFKRSGSDSGLHHFPKTFQMTLKARDDRMPLHTLLYGVVFEDGARAYRLDEVATRSVVEELVAGVPVTVWFKKHGRTAAAFDRRVGTKTLSFEAASSGRMRDEGGSLWNFEGRCIEGALKGKQLRPLHGLLTEWYGWFAHYPQTTIWKP